ncbi:MAG: hypothetical protein LQ350_008435 [Teloschistes chrysophthalmus]|nr:MAG: hypothetical protein LQ350_008435 [Niorma chrysophthalma]
MIYDPFETVLDLEDTFYKEGHELGVQDGRHIGQIEGRLFGLEKAFEKYATMGRLHGLSIIWSARLSSVSQNPESDHVDDIPRQSPTTDGEAQNAPTIPMEASSPISRIPYNTRLEKHIRTLYALTEPASLSTDNTEDAVSDFDDRLKRAKGKVKIIEKMLDEDVTGDNDAPARDEDLEMDFTSKSSQRARS